MTDPTTTATLDPALRELGRILHERYLLAARIARATWPAQETSPEAMVAAAATLFIEINKQLNGHAAPAAALLERPPSVPKACPECGSEIYDNTADNAERKLKGLKPRPLYKCKSCSWVQWRLPNGNG